MEAPRDGYKEDRANPRGTPRLGSLDFNLRPPRPLRGAGKEETSKEGMNAYRIEVYAYLPYKRELVTIQKASREAIAIKRGIDAFRASDQAKGRKIKELVAKSIRL